MQDGSDASDPHCVVVDGGPVAYGAVEQRLLEDHLPRILRFSEGNRRVT